MTENILKDRNFCRCHFPFSIYLFTVDYDVTIKILFERGGTLYDVTIDI